MNDGGFAFPIPQFAERPGMTLRDYFAAAILPYCCSGGDDTIGEASKRLGIDSSKWIRGVHDKILAAKDAYDYADAMIAEREKRDYP